jgi:hypothetical protein
MRVSARRIPQVGLLLRGRTRLRNADGPGDLLCAGCATLDRAYTKQVTWTNAPVVHVFTNTVVVSNTVPQVTERTNVLLVTNAATGAVSGYATVEPVATNFVTLLLTNFVPVFQTNVVAVPVTNLVAKPEAEATIQAAGSVVNTFLPGIGSILALALGGLYHGHAAMLRDGRQRRSTFLWCVTWCRAARAFSSSNEGRKSRGYPLVQAIAAASWAACRRGAYSAAPQASFKRRPRSRPLSRSNSVSWVPRNGIDDCGTTVRRGSGSVPRGRDVSVLFISFCRVVALPGRGGVLCSTKNPRLSGNRGCREILFVRSMRSPSHGQRAGDTRSGQRSAVSRCAGCA